jgi:hypothetical protein
MVDLILVKEEPHNYWRFRAISDRAIKSTNHYKKEPDGSFLTGLRPDFWYEQESFVVIPEEEYNQLEAGEKKMRAAIYHRYIEALAEKGFILDTLDGMEAIFTSGKVKIHVYDTGKSNANWVVVLENAVCRGSGVLTLLAYLKGHNKDLTAGEIVKKEFKAAADPDGYPVPLPVKVKQQHRYELLGYTPNKWGEH